MNTQRDRWFGLLALKAELITDSQLAQAEAERDSLGNGSLADFLTARGLISADDRWALESQLASADSAVSWSEKTARLHLAALADTDGQRADSEPALPHTEPLSPPQGRGSNHSRTSKAGILGHLADPPASESRYLPLRFLAKGGIGQIWVARDSHLGREVAVKELRADGPRDALNTARLLEEARITGQLEHPGIVPVYDLAEGSTTRQPCYTMRLVHGRTFNKAIQAFHQDRRPRSASDLEFRSLLSALVSVCNTVAYAHSRGVIHRDLKPQNVILGEYGEVILLDWGLAKLVEQAQGKGDTAQPPPPVVLTDLDDREDTQHGQAVGTLAYMAPEQASGELGEVSMATDIYGLGAMLYEILTGRAPFEAAKADALRELVCHGQPRRPSEVASGVPAALEAICLKAIARRPADRYASSRAMADDLLLWLADQAVSVYRDPISVRLGRWARRQKVLVSGAAVLLLTAVVALAISNVLLDRERSEVARAQNRSEASFMLALRAINDLLVRFSDERLAAMPEMLSLRREVADQAMRVYQSLLAFRPFEPQMFLETAKVYRQVGELQALTHDYDRARSTYLLGLDLLRRVLAEFPNDESSQQAWIELKAASAELSQRQDRPREAEPLFRSAIEAAQRLIDRFPQAPAYRRLLARLLYQQGELFRSTGRLTEALAQFETAEASWQPLAPETPYDTLGGAELVLLLAGQADCLSQLGESARAQQVADRAIRQAREQMAQTYLTVNTRFALGEALREAAEIAGDPRAALGRFDEALTLLGGLATQVPSARLYVARAADAQLGRGELRLANHDLSGALEDAGQARARLEAFGRDFPWNAECLAVLARALTLSARLALASGQTNEARQLLDQADAQRARGAALNPDSTAVHQAQARIDSVRKRLDSPLPARDQQ